MPVRKPWTPPICKCPHKTESKRSSAGYETNIVCVECGRVAKGNAEPTSEPSPFWKKLQKQEEKEMATKKTTKKTIKTRVAEITVTTGTGDMFHLRDDNDSYIEVRDVDDEVVFQFLKEEAQALAAVLTNFAKGKV